MADSIIDQMAYRLSYPVFNNQWVLSDISSGTESVQYQVKAVSLPNIFPKFSTETLPTGVQYYTKVEFDRDWSVTVEETRDMAVYRYFKNWCDHIYNHQRHTFTLTNGAYVKDFVIRMYSSKDLSSSDLSDLVLSRISNWAASTMNEVVNSALGRLATRVNGLISDALTTGGAGLGVVQRAASYPMNVLTGTAQNLVSSGVDMLLQNTGAQGDVEVFTVVMRGCLLKEIEKLDLDYEEGEPVQWKASLSCDSINVSSGESVLDSVL